MPAAPTIRRASLLRAATALVLGTVLSLVLASQALHTMSGALANGALASGAGARALTARFTARAKHALGRRTSVEFAVVVRRLTGWLETDRTTITLRR